MLSLWQRMYSWLWLKHLAVKHCENIGTSSMPSQGSMSRASCCAWSASTSRPVPSCSMDFDLHGMTGLYASRNYAAARPRVTAYTCQSVPTSHLVRILSANLPAGRRKLMLCGMATSPSSDAMPLRSATTFSSNTAGGIVMRCLQCNKTARLHIQLSVTGQTAVHELQTGCTHREGRRKALVLPSCCVCRASYLRPRSALIVSGCCMVSVGALLRLKACSPELSASTSITPGMPGAASSSSRCVSAMAAAKAAEYASSAAAALSPVATACALPRCIEQQKTLLCNVTSVAAVPYLRVRWSVPQQEPDRLLALLALVSEPHLLRTICC